MYLFHGFHIYIVVTPCRHNQTFIGHLLYFEKDLPFGISFVTCTAIVSHTLNWVFGPTRIVKYTNVARSS